MSNNFSHNLLHCRTYYRAEFESGFLYYEYGAYFLPSFQVRRIVANFGPIFFRFFSTKTPRKLGHRKRKVHRLLPLLPEYIIPGTVSLSIFFHQPGLGPRYGCVRQRAGYVPISTSGQSLIYGIVGCCPTKGSYKEADAEIYTDQHI